MLGDLAALVEKGQQFAPLLVFAKRATGTMTDAELGGIAKSLAGEAAEDLLPLLQILRDKEPETMVPEILSSPSARKLFQSMKQQTEAANRVIFCTCPCGCGVSFETEI